jgi:glycosyltransferase involved in cell wall biosynthesis
MRVLHLTTEFPPVIFGGLGTAVGGLVKASANAGIATAVLLFGESAGASYGKFVSLPEAVRTIPVIRSAVGATIFEVSWFQGIDAIAQTAAKWCPDVLHLHSFWLWPLAQGLRARLGKPLVYTVASLVLFNGRFVERKGIHELMEAIEIVLAQAPAVRFVLAGGHRGCSAAQMESWLLPPQLCRVRNQIQFTGWLTPQELTNWYRRADILVVPSWYEPFGMVILEGMLHRVTIAACAVGGPSEILDHERTGLLFPAKNAKALAKAILRLVHDPNLRLSIAAAGAREVREKWLWRHIIEKMAQVYLELVPAARVQPMLPKIVAPRALATAA